MDFSHELGRRCQVRTRKALQGLFPSSIEPVHAGKPEEELYENLDRKASLEAGDDEPTNWEGQR